MPGAGLTASPRQCSSLMLIESTRDSLCFSLAHYKHGKQQHSLQVGGHRVLGGHPRDTPYLTLLPSLSPFPGQDRGGEAPVDPPHQEAHPGESPRHHPPEGEGRAGRAPGTTLAPGSPRPGMARRGWLHPSLTLISPQAKEAILEMDLFCECHQHPAVPPARPCLSLPRPPASPPVPADPPHLPRCSPERLKKSWSCQPLGDAVAEPRQGRRQSGESRMSPMSPVVPRVKLWPGGAHSCRDGGR